MAGRKALEIPEIEPEEVISDLKWVPSGSVVLDLVLSGGYPQGRIINLVGDRSSGKTLLAIEAMANFVASVGKAQHVKYVDAESAFDEGYASVLGLPSGIQTSDGGMETVQEFFADIEAFLKDIPENTPSLYILDSLDALSDTEEMGRDYDKGSYGAAKAKMLSQFFRRMVSELARKNCLLIVISQIRDKIGVVFGETKTRSGGKALDFYCSQIIWLAEVGKIKKTALNVERVIGIETKVRTKKNKVGLPFREAELTVIFNYGIDDEVSMLNWLKDAKVIEAKEYTTIKSGLDTARKARDLDAIRRIRDDLADRMTEQWFRIEERIAPPMRKYG